MERLARARAERSCELAKSITWLGHAAFTIRSANDRMVYIDPFLVGNPLCPITMDDISQAHLVLVTHAHFDHLGNAVDIAKNTGATFVTQPEAAAKLTSESGLPAEQVCNFGSGMNIGGSIAIEGITVTMTQAFHSSQIASCTGFIIRLEDGFTIYHAGDTGIFATMKILGELYSLDLALLPIGSVFTMDPVQAAKALSLLNPRRAVPMHYRTFPVLEQSAERFVELARKEAPHVEVVVLEPGQELIL